MVGHHRSCDLITGLWLVRTIEYFSYIMFKCISCDFKASLCTGILIASSLHSRPRRCILTAPDNVCMIWKCVLLIMIVLGNLTMTIYYGIFFDLKSELKWDKDLSYLYNPCSYRSMCQMCQARFSVKNLFMGWDNGSIPIHAASHKTGPVKFLHPLDGVCVWPRQSDDSTRSTQR